MREVKRALGYRLFPCDAKEKGVLLGTVKLSPSVARWGWDRKGGVEAPRISIPHAPPGSPSKLVGARQCVEWQTEFQDESSNPTQSDIAVPIFLLCRNSGKVTVPDPLSAPSPPFHT